MNDLYGVLVLDLACLLAAGALLRAWRRRRTRPPLVAAAFLGVLMAIATMLVLFGIPYRIVVLPTFILALLVILYSARYESRSIAPRK